MSISARRIDTPRPRLGGWSTLNATGEARLPTPNLPSGVTLAVGAAGAVDKAAPDRHERCGAIYLVTPCDRFLHRPVLIQGAAASASFPIA